MCCVFASLLLSDDGREVNAANISDVVKASGNSVESYWPNLFSNAIAGRDINDLLTSGSGNAGPAQATEGGNAGPAKEAEPVKEEEEEAFEIGGLFD
mmetsp:Transcript_32543/g.28809  ORF Transcript_32543/g.28809 Transcript_32543/m.28809 type:complete len:97 (-) Transcript_32543:29-319(-)